MNFKLLVKLFILLLFTVFLSACNIDFKKYFSETETNMRKAWPKTNFNKRSINLDEIVFQAVERDGIPPIHNPRFEKAKSVTWLNKREPVIVIENNKKAKAYPLQILIFHEIVTDSINNIPITVTFCPLCNASLVYNRKVHGKTLVFGVSGSLRKSDLVMYDHQTHSWWQQFTGTGIVGDYTGTQLDLIPSKVVAFEDFQTNFPNGLVLSRDTGFNRLYGENPYAGYDSVDRSPFYFDPHDPRIRPMERVLAIQDMATSRIYPLSRLKRHSVINDSINNKAIVIFSKKGMLSVLDKTDIEESKSLPSAAAYSRVVNGIKLTFKNVSTNIVDTQTDSVWNILGLATQGVLKGTQLKQIDRGVHFAFAWLAFKPNSEIYSQK